MSKTYSQSDVNKLYADLISGRWFRSMEDLSFIRKTFEDHGFIEKPNWKDFITSDMRRQLKKQIISKVEDKNESNESNEPIPKREREAIFVNEFYAWYETHESNLSEVGDYIENLSRKEIIDYCQELVLVDNK